MVFGLLMLFALYLLWVLFVQGALWKIILFFAGWAGIYFLMRIYVSGADKIAITITDYTFSWAAVIPTVICIFALLTTRVEE
jgi:hypothetical protein